MERLGVMPVSEQKSSGQRLTQSVCAAARQKRMPRGGVGNSESEQESVVSCKKGVGSSLSPAARENVGTSSTTPTLEIVERSRAWSASSRTTT